MSTVIVAAILIGIIAAISFLLMSLDKKHKTKRMNKLLHHFSELGSTYLLNFSSQTILKNNIIGLDGIHRKVLVLFGKEEAVPDHELIHLEEVRQCSVKKLYNTIYVGALKDKKIDEFLQKIVLCFEFRSQKQTLEVPFYDHVADPVYLVTELEQKAKDWESVLSKLLKASGKKVA